MIAWIIRLHKWSWTVRLVGVNLPIVEFESGKSFYSNPCVCLSDHTCTTSLSTYIRDMQILTHFHPSTLMADDIYPLDPTLCTNPDSPGECCGDSFDHKTSPGLCAKCYITSTNAERAEIMKVCFCSIFDDLIVDSQYIPRKDWPQCKGCSAQFKLLKAPLCGTCAREGRSFLLAFFKCWYLYTF
jgi:hypothetical protein